MVFHGFFLSDTIPNRKYNLAGKTQANPAACESSDRINMLKSEFIAVSDKNAELRKQVRELTEKLRFAEQGKDQAQNALFP